MNNHQVWWSSTVDHAQVTVAGPVPSAVDLEVLLSGNGSRLTDEEIERLILESPFLLRPGSSNFDPATQVSRPIVLAAIIRFVCARNVFFESYRYVRILTYVILTYVLYQKPESLAYIIATGSMGLLVYL